MKLIKQPICPVDGCRRIDLFTSKNSFKIYRCLLCGLVFVWPMPRFEKLLYSQDYFSGAKKGHGYADYNADKEANVAIFNRYLDQIEKFITEKGKILDVGTATGNFLELAKKRGWEVQGLEISSYAASRAKENGFKVHIGSLENASLKNNYFELITLWDVIEHIKDPKTALLKANKMLKTQGLLAINTADAKSVVAQLLNVRWYSLIPPEHLILFNQQNLKNLLEKCGFKIVYKKRFGKRFTLQYLSRLLANWSKWNLLNIIADLFAKNKLGKLSIPLNLRDNIFIIAKKANSKITR